MIIRLMSVIVFFLILFTVSCSDSDSSKQKRILTQSQVTEKLVEANRVIVKAENDQIDKLILRNNWNMTQTATGLRYEMIETGKGKKTAGGNLVKFEYEVKLISGETIYSSSISGTKEFRLGSGGVESGLEEGMLLLHEGDKARFIIPSYLAHGLAGDQDKIPSKATLIYIVKLIEAK